MTVNNSVLSTPTKVAGVLFGAACPTATVCGIFDAAPEGAMPPRRPYFPA
jgi:hypothetical protein